MRTSWGCGYAPSYDDCCKSFVSCAICIDNVELTPVALGLVKTKKVSGLPCLMISSDAWLCKELLTELKFTYWQVRKTLV